MTENQYTFDAAQYLKDNPAVANPAVWQSTPWAHYLESGGKNSPYKATFREAAASDPSNWEAVGGLTDLKDPESTASYLKDPNTGNIYSVISNEDTAPSYKLVASGEALTDPYISALALNYVSPAESQKLYDLKTTNPSEFYGKVANQLADAYANNSKQNWQGVEAKHQNEQAILGQLESLKDVDPKAYYTGKLSLLSQLSGWDYGQNTPERSAARIAEIKSMIPAAKAAGLNADQIQSLTTGNINKASQENQQRIANEAQSGNFYMQSLIGAAKVGALALGAYGLDTALAAGLAEGGAIGGAGGSELAGPTYGELGYTGLSEGAAGPTYAEMGFTGLNQGEAITAADMAAAQAANPEMSLKDAYKAYSRTKQIANLLQNATGTGSSTASKSGFSPTQLASALAPVQEQFGGLYRMNQNPFAPTQQAAAIQTPLKQKDFLAELAQEGTQPTNTLANLVRTA